MTICDNLCAFLVISASSALVYLVYVVLDWYRKRSSEFKKYGIENFEYGYQIQGINQERVYQIVMIWLKELNSKEIESNSIEHIHAYHENIWESDEGTFIGWEKYIDFKITPVGDKIRVVLTLTPSPNYKTSPMGDNVVIGWDRLARQLKKDFHSIADVEYQDLSNKTYMQKMLDDLKNSYQVSMVLLIIFLGVTVSPFTYDTMQAAGTMFGVGLLGFLLYLFKFASDYANYWAMKDKIKKEFGI